jgi:hypothetical protein
MLYLSVNAIHNMQMWEKSIVRYQNTGTPKPLANPTECHAAWENPTLLVTCNKGYQVEEPPRISADW